MKTKTHKVIEEGLASFDALHRNRTTSVSKSEYHDWLRAYSQRLVEVTREEERERMIDQVYIQLGKDNGREFEEAITNEYPTLTKDTPAEE